MPKASSSPVNVVYVLSTGRSGSTLLEMLLASAPNAWTVGEVQLLPFEIGHKGYRCGCGESLEKCAFWGDLLDDLSFEASGVRLTYFRRAHNRGQTWRSARLLEMLVRGQWRPSRRARAYGKINRDLFTRVRDRAEALNGEAPGWIIDASKDPYRLYWLLQSDDINVRVVHLVRGPHGFVSSSLKGREFSSPVLRQLEVVRLSLRWCVANLIFAFVCWRGSRPGQSVRVRYEDLAQQPQETLAQLGEAIGAVLETDPERFRMTDCHAIAGNQTRWSASNIKLDEAWRHDLGWVERALVSIISAVISISLASRS